MEDESAVDDEIMHDATMNDTAVDDEGVGNDEVFVDKAMDDTYVTVDNGAVCNVYRPVEDAVVIDAVVI